jgi:spermidine/putrescine transport system ATP-binding protein
MSARPLNAREDGAIHTPDAAPGFIDIVDITKRFGEVEAVRGVSLSLRRGEFISLLGPSGCGKTTTLRMLAGFERPDSGSVMLGGRDVVNTPPNRRPVNTVFQSYALFGHLDVFDNIAFGLREKRRPRAEIRQAVAEAVELVRLRGFERRKPRELSGGQQQRVALARALVNAPELLLLDEPLGALDLKLRRAMQIELKSLQRRLGMTFLYVTHDQEEAFTMSDRVAVMEGGEIVQIGAPEEIYERPATLYVADFVGEANILRGTLAGSDEDGASVILPSGRRLHGRRTASESGAAVRLIVRPEKIEVGAPDDPAAATSGLIGTVEQTIFLGSTRKLLVTVEDGATVGVTQLNRGRLRDVLAPGASVWLDWDAEDAWILPERSV